MGPNVLDIDYRLFLVLILLIIRIHIQNNEKNANYNQIDKFLKIIPFSMQRYVKVPCGSFSQLKPLQQGLCSGCPGIGQHMSLFLRQSPGSAANINF